MLGFQPGFRVLFPSGWSHWLENRCSASRHPSVYSLPRLSSPRPFAELQPHFRLPPHCSLPVGFLLLPLLLEAETVILPHSSPCILPYSPVELRIPHLKWLLLLQTQSSPVKGTCPGLSTGTFLSTSPRAFPTDSPISSLIMQVPYCLDSILLLWKNTLRIAR